MLAYSGCKNKTPKSIWLNEWLKKKTKSKNRNVFLIILEATKFKIKVLADSLPGESPFPDLQTVTFILCPHMAENLLSLPLLRALYHHKSPYDLI